MKDVHFPKDISEDYVPTWEAFLKMKMIGQLRMYQNSEKAIPECFRLLIRQAGAKFPLRNAVEDFVVLRTHMAALRTFLQRSGLLDHMRVTRHVRFVEYDESKAACALINLKFVGEVVLTHQRFDLDYLIDRMQGRAFKTKPIELSSKMPNGSKRKVPSVNALSPRDFTTLYEEKGLCIRLVLAKNALVLQYEIKPNVVVPLYQRANAALQKLWRTTTMGVF